MSSQEKARGPLALFDIFQGVWIRFNIIGEKNLNGWTQAENEIQILQEKDIM